MKGIGRYIFRQVTGATLFAAVALTSAIYLGQSLRLIDLIVNRGVSLGLFTYMTILMLPSFLIFILPISLFAATTFVYNRMAAESEIVVMQAAGLGPARLARPALLLAAFFTLIGYALTTYFVPLSYREFRDFQIRIRSDYSTILLQEGVFNTVGNNITVFVRERSAEGELRGILVHDNRDANRPMTAMAEVGTIVQTPDGPRVIMVHGNRQEVSKESGKLSLLYFDRYTLDIKGGQLKAEARWYEPHERYLPDLFWPSNNPDDVNNFNKLRAEGHDRLVAPLFAFGFACIALAALLGGEFSRRGQFRRILGGIVAVILVQAAKLAFQNLAAKSPAFIPLMYVNAFAPIGIGLFLVMRRRRWVFMAPAPVSAGSA